MTKETLEQAIYLEERIQRVQEEIDLIKKLDNLTKEVSLVNYNDNITIFLSVAEKELILPALLERKTEELRLLQNEFERL